MACIRKRRGKYVVDYRDGAGIRRWVTCETRREAETVLLDKAREARQPTRPVVDPNITMSAYAERWLQAIAVTIKPKTRKSYGSGVRLHISARARVYKSQDAPEGAHQVVPRREAQARQGTDDRRGRGDE